MVWWLKFCAPNAGGQGLVPGRGTKSCIPQLRPSTVKKKKKTLMDEDTEVLGGWHTRSKALRFPPPRASPYSGLLFGPS